MPNYYRHILSQSRGLAALATLLVSDKRGSGVGPVPGALHEALLPAPADALIDDFVRFCGGAPATYRDTVPPHLFCQWSLPLMLRVASHLPYPATKVINAGCRLRVVSPLRRGQRLRVTAQLTALEEDARRAKLTISTTTAVVGEEPALFGDLHVRVPLESKRPGNGRDARPSGARERPRVPPAVRELGRLRFAADAGADFAKLTGDFNPIHWSRAYARAAGFRGVILHGFGMFSRVYEGLVRGLLSFDAARLVMLEAAFTRPLVLPAMCGVYIGAEHDVYLGDAPGGGAYMVGSYEIGRS